MLADPRLRSEVTARLAAAGCVDPEGEADELLAAATDRDQLDGWLSRREEGEPPAWITGTAVFCGRRLRVDPGVYVPRPQSEELARRAAAVLPSNGRALDLCCGSGALAAHLVAAVPSATVIAVDLDPRAIRCARSNGLAAIRGDLAEAVIEAPVFDVICAVAPYVPTDAVRFLPGDVQRHEPRLALDGGADGLDPTRRIVDAAARRLRPGGWLLAELGADQDDTLAPALAADFEELTPWYDEDGDLRGLSARRAPG
ncbi:MAG: HemK/PrmC family methyltransferase [Actinomycetota bacterium]|nr:HemK/PrmC family methyltransferase [Actinomycetota bacterium]